MRLVRRAARIGVALGRGLRPGVLALAAALATLAAHVSYRRRELGVLVLLAASVLGGYGIDAWRKRDPATLDRLEAEPPRLVAATRASSASRGASARPARLPTCPDSGGPGRPAALTRPVPTPETPLDLNRATAGELARLPGIGPRLAERILARRRALGGRFRSPEELATVPGLGRERARLVGALVTAGVAPAAEPAEQGEGAAPDGPDGPTGIAPSAESSAEPEPP